MFYHLPSRKLVSAYDLDRLKTGEFVIDVNLLFKLNLINLFVNANVYQFMP